MTDSIAGFRFLPLLPSWLLLALALVALASVGLALWRRARGAWLRAAAFALLLAWLAGPTLVRETRQGLKDIALLAIDRSASMGVGPRAALADATAAALRRQAAAFPDLELREAVSPEQGTEGTRLWSDTARALADIPADRLAGILLVTDGQVHDLPPGGAGQTLPPGVPVHALIPARAEEWDRRVRVTEAPGYGIVGHAVDVKLAIEDLGHAAGMPPEGGTATLTLRRDGRPPEIRDVPVGAEQTISVPIDRAGPTILEFATPAAPAVAGPPSSAEASPLNNRAIVQINGVRDRLRVLLVSGEPNQDERTWRRLLKSDPAVDLVHFTILRPPERDDLTPLNELALIAFPTRELFQEKLSGFDLIILDRFTDRGILPHAYLRNIANYVQRGGALLLTAGPEFAGPGTLDQTPLAEVLPSHAAGGAEAVRTGAFRPRVTALGLRHPVTENLVGANTETTPPAWGSWYRTIASVEPEGQVVMTGLDGAPLLVLRHEAQGRVAELLSDQIWLWSRGHQGGGPQAELLRRVSHWLMGEPELDENRLTARLDSGTLTIDRRTVEGPAAVPVTITPPTGPDRTVVLTQTAPGAATARLDAPGAGVWRVTDGPRTAFAAATVANAPEYADLRATTDRLAGLTRPTGGGTVWLAASGPPALRRVDPRALAAGPGWVGLRRRSAHVVTGVETTPLLPSWLALALLLGVTVAAWRREAK